MLQLNCLYVYNPPQNSMPRFFPSLGSNFLTFPTLPIAVIPPHSINGRVTDLISHVLVPVSQHHHGLCALSVDLPSSTLLWPDKSRGPHSEGPLERAPDLEKARGLSVTPACVSPPLEAPISLSRRDACQFSVVAKYSLCKMTVSREVLRNCKDITSGWLSPLLGSLLLLPNILFGFPLSQEVS